MTTRLNIDLRGLDVGISAAVTVPKHWREPAMDQGVMEFVSVLSGMILKYGGRVIHGSHPTFTPILLRQARRHAAARARRPLTLVMSEFWAKDLPAGYAASISDVAEFVVTPEGAGERGYEIREESLAIMRRALVEAQSVMVAVGGQLWGESSRFGLRPGLGFGALEEIALAREREIPTFLIGGLAGYSEAYVSEVVPPDLNNGLSEAENAALFATRDVAGCVNVVFNRLVRKMNG